MTKQTVETLMDFVDWTDQFDGRTVGQAIEWLSKIPKDFVMKVDSDYGGSEYGEIYEVREETDEEYSARVAKECQDEEDRWAAKRKAEEQLAERMMLIAAKDVAFKAYMEKHKDNPNIGDLSNLFMAAMSLTKAGVQGSALAPLLACMERLEKEGGTA
jgi:hypothetical protein